MEVVRDNVQKESIIDTIIEKYKDNDKVVSAEGNLIIPGENNGYFRGKVGEEYISNKTTVVEEFFHIVLNRLNEINERQGNPIKMYFKCVSYDGNFGTNISMETVNGIFKNESKVSMVKPNFDYITTDKDEQKILLDNAWYRTIYDIKKIVEVQFYLSINGKDILILKEGFPLMNVKELLNVNQWKNKLLEKVTYVCLNMMFNYGVNNSSKIIEPILQQMQIEEANRIADTKVEPEVIN